MNYENCNVLLFGHNENLEQELARAGMPVEVLKDSGLCKGLGNALAGSQAKLFLTLRAGDGFSAADVLKVADALLADASKVYLGERVLPEKKSLPQNIYGFLSGIEAKDITTSLYGMSRDVLETISCTKTKDRAFFQNIPLAARSGNIAVESVPVEASANEAPGWTILLSTGKLYQVFIKFSIAAFIAYLVDIGTFYVFQKLFSGMDDEFKILTATVLSRILCSIATYLLNRGAVFNSNAKSTGAVVRFVILAVGQLVASWLLVWGIGSLLGGGDAVNTMLKVIVDLVIFLASFTLQRDWVFKESKGLLK